MPGQITTTAALRVSITLGPQDELTTSIPARHFAFARLKSQRGQAMNYVALAYLPKHSQFHADLPRPAARYLHLISDRTGQPPLVAATLAARMLAGFPVAAPKSGGEV